MTYLVSQRETISVNAIGIYVFIYVYVLKVPRGTLMFLVLSHHIWSFRNECEKPQDVVAELFMVVSPMQKEERAWKILSFMRSCLGLSFRGE